MIENMYNLTPLQQGMLFQSIAEEASDSYIIQNVFEFKIGINLELFRYAVDLVALKYDVIRTAIPFRNFTKPRQIILLDRKIPCDYIDYSQLNDDEFEAQFQVLQKNDIKRGFDMEVDPLMRICVVNMSDSKSRLIITWHHIILDGWSSSIIINSLFELYELLKLGHSYEELAKEIQAEKKNHGKYAEYVKWVTERRTGKDLAYWKNLLSDYDGDARIIPSEKVDGFGEQVAIIADFCDSITSQKLHAVATKNKVTINTIAETAWSIVLQ
ncbi:MAG: condensation domain-containing protein, partial [Bacilli bacterium]|nr:condensation domain-containing protein [Bacilli bacterium]